MNKNLLSLGCLLAVFFLLPLFTWAQSFAIDEVKPRGFRGTYEIEGVGYYACYKQKGDYQLHLLDYDLKPVKKVPLEGMKVEGYLHSVSNGQAIVLAHFDITKGKRQVIVYDKNLVQKGLIKINQTITDVLPVGDKGFAIITQKGSKNIVTFYDNNLKETKEVELGKKISVSSANIEHKAFMTSNTQMMAQLGMAEFSSYSSTTAFQQDLEKNIVAWKSENKGFRPISQTLYVYDTNGNEKGNYFFDLKKEFPVFGYSFGDELRLLVYSGSFEKIKSLKVESLSTYVFDQQCNLKKKIDHDINVDVGYDNKSNILKTPIPVDMVFGKEKHVITQTSLNGHHFEFIAFDTEGNFLGMNKVNKILPKNIKETKRVNIITPFTPAGYDVSKFCHSSFTADQNKFYAVYYNIEDEVISFHVSYADQKGISPSKTDLLHEEEVGKGEDENATKINYFKVFKAEPGNAVTAFYSAKKKSILFAKFDVDGLTAKGDGTTKQ